MATTTTTSSAAAATAPSSRSSEVVRRTMQSLVLLIVLICAVIAVAWLVLNPRPPTFRLDSLHLSGLPNASSDASSLPPKLSVRIQLTSTNPNKRLGVVIRDVKLWLALVHHKPRLPLSSHNETSPSEYYICKRGRRVLKFEMKAGPTPGHGNRGKMPFRFTVGEDLRKGSVVMWVVMNVRVEFMHGDWPSKQAWVNAACEDLSIGLSSSRRTGELKDGGKDCSARFP